MLITYRDLVFVAILPEGGGREPLLDEGLAAVHDGATWDQITDCFFLTGVVEPARFQRRTQDFGGGGEQLPTAPPLPKANTYLYISNLPF